MKVEVKNVTKKIRKNTILENVNIIFEEGKIYGLIGPNGAGKSVLLKMICTFYEPTIGEILFDGKNLIKEKKYPYNTGAMIEKPYFLPDLSGKENLILLASIQNKIGEEEINNILEKVALQNDKDKLFHQYSLGMKQKLGIAQTLMEDPKVIILDEPFNGLEEESATNIRKILLQEKKKGKIIIIATHIKEDLEVLCDEIYRFSNKRVEKLDKMLLNKK